MLEYYIPTRAGCSLPLCFAFLWAKLVRINQPHCSQIGIVSQLKLDPIGSKLCKLNTTLSLQPDVPTALFGMLAALWYLPESQPDDLCLDQCPLQPALATSPAGEEVGWSSENGWLGWSTKIQQPIYMNNSCHLYLPGMQSCFNIQILIIIFH